MKKLKNNLAEQCRNNFIAMLEETGIYSDVQDGPYKQYLKKINKLFERRLRWGFYTLKATPHTKNITEKEIARATVNILEIEDIDFWKNCYGGVEDIEVCDAVARERFGELEYEKEESK